MVDKFSVEEVAWPERSPDLNTFEVNWNGVSDRKNLVETLWKVIKFPIDVMVRCLNYFVRTV